MLLLIAIELLLAALVFAGRSLYRLGVRNGAKSVAVVGEAVSSLDPVTRAFEVPQAPQGLDVMHVVEDASAQDSPGHAARDRLIAHGSLHPLPDAVPVVAEPEPSWLHALMATQVIVHTTDDRSIEGLLVMESTKGIILRNAKLLDEGRAPVPMAGETWLPKESIFIVQVPGTQAA
jgi:hypothetical protein